MSRAGNWICQRITWLKEQSTQFTSQSHFTSDGEDQSSWENLRKSSGQVWENDLSDLGHLSVPAWSWRRHICVTNWRSGVWEMWAFTRQKESNETHLHYGKCRSQCDRYLRLKVRIFFFHVSRSSPTTLWKYSGAEVTVLTTVTCCISYFGLSANSWPPGAAGCPPHWRRPVDLSCSGMWGSHTAPPGHWPGQWWTAPSPAHCPADTRTPDTTQHN